MDVATKSFVLKPQRLVVVEWTRWVGLVTAPASGSIPCIPCQPNLEFGVPTWVLSFRHVSFDRCRQRKSTMRIPVRISLVFWAIVLVTLFGYAISRLLFFKSLFFEHAGIRLTQPEVATASVDKAGPEAPPRVQQIPKLVHHVFHNWRVPGNDTLPADWAEIRQNCMNLNPDFDFKVRPACPSNTYRCSLDRR